MPVTNAIEYTSCAEKDAVLCYAMLCYAMLCYAMLCYAVCMLSNAEDACVC